MTEEESKDAVDYPIEEYYFITEKSAEEPEANPGGYYGHIVNRFWWVHPGKGLLVYKGRKGKFKHPQCNSSEK
jgi:hypothetical protein